jgi:hypothetical protein
MSDKNFIIYEIKLKVFGRDSWVCQNCGKLLTQGIPQVAQRIPQKDRYINKYGENVIHHIKNLVSTCSLKCNAKFDLNGKEILIEKLAKEIKKELTK